MECACLRSCLWLLLLSCVSGNRLHAGGSGLNTVVVINQTSLNSRELGNYYCERRQVPPQNVLRIYWTGGNTSWSSNDFQTILLTPLLDMLAARQLTNQIDYVVLSMDIPFKTVSGSTINGTTSALFYGLRGGGDPGITNSYAASESVFGQSKPASAPGFSFLAAMITSDSLANAMQLVDRGVASDGTFPLTPVVLVKTSDPDRNLRYRLFDNAMFNVRIRGISSIFRTNCDAIWWPGSGLGYQTGLSQFSLWPGALSSGAVADSMTSYGGVIFGSNSQSNLLAFINAGASGSYGTVAEPGTDTEKFPDPQVYFYQARGFNVAESYYQSLNVPYLGLVVAEPLAAPFARAGYGNWAANLTNAVLSGIAPLSMQFSSSFGASPLQGIDLFVDGKYLSTLTNLAPRQGNLLSLSLNGYAITYVVPTNATLESVAAGLAAAINDPVVTNATRTKALTHGDRIELQSVATNLFSVPYFVADTVSTGSPASSYRVTYLPDSFPPRMIPSGWHNSGVFRMDVEVPTARPYVIEASTNLADWVPLLTTTVPGLLEFQDNDAINYPYRFYRVLGMISNQIPTLSEPAILGDSSIQMHLDSDPGQACAILASSNLVDWESIFTNQLGGSMDFNDVDSPGSMCRFYQAWLVPPAPPAFTVLNGASSLVRIDSAVRPYTVEVSTNEGEWIVLSTNFAIGEIQTAASSAIGEGDAQLTFLSASRPRFLSSDAYGLQSYTVPTSSPPIGAWVQLTITKTNGTAVVVGVTNQSGVVGSADLASQLCALLNANPALQGSDGLVAEDFDLNSAGSASFNLRARNPGAEAAGIRVLPKRSAGIYILPSSQRTLTQNLSDLQSRNHLYLTMGVSSLELSIPFDTTILSDGYHSLTAVAYEGNNVRNQTRATVPVRVQNTTLSATFTLLDVPNPAPVQGTYHFEVVPNTNNVSKITLYSTGGALGWFANQSSATFEIYGTNLWVGLHPFYSIVETPGGDKYRTETRWVRFIDN